MPASSRIRSRTIGRLGARLIIQQALEDELTEFLGRGRYERTGTPVAHRNGYEQGRRRSRRPRGRWRSSGRESRDASRLGFESRIVGKGIARTYALETLVICSFLRGLSVRDVEATLEETFDQPVISRQRSRACWRTPGSATAAGASAGSTSTTLCTCSSMRST